MTEDKFGKNLAQKKHALEIQQSDTSSFFVELNQTV
jgi:hypothetical protein